MSKTMKRLSGGVLLMLWMMAASVMAQAPVGGVNGDERAERIFGFLCSDQADSLFEAMTPQMQAALPRNKLGGLLAQVEAQAGTYGGHGAWTHERRDSIDVYQSVVSFERMKLSALVSFNDSGKLCGLRLLPYMEPAAQPTIPLPADAIELDDTIRTADGLALPATVTLSGRSASPAIVVMVHGSGPLDRDETVLANKPFRDLACQLAERGISSLRYDKRTYVTRQPVTSMDEETINDALAAIRQAHHYSGNVYLLGHSLGAMLAPIIAQRAEGQLSGLVMMAAPARDMLELLREQMDHLYGDAPDSVKQQTIESVFIQSPHYREPQGQVAAARQSGLPMLLMQGGRDYQVSMAQDFTLWQQALQGRDGVVLKAYPALNHLFLEGEGPSQPLEYNVPGRIPQQVADDIATFINHQ